MHECAFYENFNFKTRYNTPFAATYFLKKITKFKPICDKLFVVLKKKLSW